MLIREILEQIRNTAGSNDKRAIFDANKSELLELVFTDTYDKSRNYYVKKYDKTYVGPGNLFDGLLVADALTIDNDYHIFHELLNMLNERYFTGNEAITQVEDTIAMFIPEDRPVLHAIMDRNLKIGIACDLFNKSVENEINKFEVALAYNLDKVKNVNPIDGTYFASRKLDGVRCIAIVDSETNTVDLFSRQGKKFTSLNHLKQPLLDMFSHYSGKIVFDGELCAVDEYGNEDFSKAVKLVTKKDQQAIGIKYCLFDIIPYNVFIGKDDSDISPMDFTERYDTLTEMFNDHKYDGTVGACIMILEQERILSQEQFDKWTKMVEDNDWEGFMLRKDAPYKSGRTKDLIKVKKFQDSEYIVKDITTGKACYNEGGMKEYDIVSGLVIEHKGNRVTVGSGLSKEQRISWFNDPTQILGKVITVQYFEETQDSKTKEYSLRFPVLKHVYLTDRDC